MERLKEHVSQYYAYHGVEVTRSNAETCVVTLPPQFRDLSAFTADLWCEFGAVVDIAIIHGTIEATIRMDNASIRTGGRTGSVLSMLVVGAAVVVGYTLPLANFLSWAK